MRKMKRKQKKKMEFAKFILALYAVWCIAWIEQNFVLAFMEKQQINESVTNTIIVTLVAAILGYYVKSAGEKVSRNISKVDENGVPYSIDYERDEC